MATAHPLTPSAGEQTSAAGTVKPGSATVADQAMVPTSYAHEHEQIFAPSSPVARLPVELEVSVPVRGFRVRNLLTLELSQLIESGWTQGDDVPLAAGRVQLAWSEFEVVDTQLAVRVTRLA